ncbi:TetR/AcrR family transcriptional regulator [Nocardia amikacinitolerans]|uniref:TetR/AcrR family transcriptional regulator n=1 Tax=Nocardia amikacinitolerans TaxID=756689 RepID=UPI0020A34C81|nr:TetR/AcrR family transcriptional regulator [Nocardia amikacinitolerans]MCP2279665.1 transcriptional regulator, TetR family [Nocardia amikacinitolerans]
MVKQPEPAARRGRPTGNHEAKRAELLRAATAVIAEEGYAKASLRKVAQRAGCTTGAVTYYFANKEELITALVESRFDRYDAMLEAAREQNDIPALIRRWLAMTTSDSQHWPVMSEVLVHARSEPALAELIRKRYAQYRDTHASIIEAAQADGAIRDDIPAELLGDQLAAMGDGWTMMYPFEPDRFTPARAQALVDAAIELISPVPACSPGADDA